MIKTAIMFVFASAVSAYAWTVEELNHTIEQTNVIVGNHCSGTIIDLDHRLVLTNNHCVEKYIRRVQRDKVDSKGVVSKVTVEEMYDVPISQKTYSGHKLVSELSFITEIVGRDEEHDLALLQFRKEKIPQTIASTIFTGDKVYRGEVVYAVGNPMMLDAAVTKGIISSVNRLIKMGNVELSFYQIDAGIVGGNSGGSLYNDRGELIGVPAAGARGTSVGLAIPYTDVKHFLEELCYASVYDKTLGETHYEECIEEQQEQEEKEEK